MDSSMGSNYASCYMNNDFDGSPWKQRNNLSRSFSGTKLANQGIYTDSPGFTSIQQNSIAPPVVRYNENLYSWFYGILATRQFTGNQALFICTFGVLFLLALSARFTLWLPLDSIIGEFSLLFNWKFWTLLFIASGLFGFGFGYFSFNYLFSPYNETQMQITKLGFWRSLAAFVGLFVFGVLTLPFVIGIIPSWGSNFTTSLLLFVSLLVTSFKIVSGNVFRYTFNSKLKNQFGWKAVFNFCLMHWKNNAWDSLQRTMITLQYSYIASFLIALFFGFLRKNILSLLDPMLVFHIGVVIYASYVLADLTCITANSVMCEGIDFPMPTAFFFSDARETVVNLVNAMNSSDLLMRQFAFYDFRIKSQSDQKAAFFTLSQPGNHPRLWSAIVNQCLFIVDYISGVYLKEAEIALANNRIPGFQMSQSLSGDRLMKTSMLLPPGLKPKQPESKNIPLVNLEPVKVVIKPYFDKVYNFIFTPQHIVSTAESELALNGIEGLANLVEASYKMDKYGMAQKSLPVIIGSFLKLAVACDQLIRAKSMRRVSASPVECRVFETKEVVVASLNDIYTAFQSHINDLHLSSDQLTILKEYVETI